MFKLTLSELLCDVINYFNDLNRHIYMYLIKNSTGNINTKYKSKSNRTLLNKFN